MNAAARHEWLAQRKGVCTGTKAPIICGVAPRSRGTAFDLWMAEQGLVPEQEQSMAMLLGTLAEEPILERVRLEYGCDVRPVGFIRDGWRGGTPDGFDPGPRRVHEVKVTADIRQDIWGDDDYVTDLDSAPPWYQIQGLWYADLLGAASVEFDVLIVPHRSWDVLAGLAGMPERRQAFAESLAWGCELRRIWMRPDPEDIAAVKRVCGDWWQRHVVGGEAPPVDGSDGADEWLRRRFPEWREKPVVDLAPHAAEMLVEYRALSALEQDTKRRKEHLAQEIVLAMAGDKRGQSGTHKVTICGGGTTRRLDVDKLKTEHPAAYAACLSESANALYPRVSERKEGK